MAFLGGGKSNIVWVCVGVGIGLLIPSARVFVLNQNTSHDHPRLMIIEGSKKTTVKPVEQIDRISVSLSSRETESIDSDIAVQGSGKREKTLSEASVAELRIAYESKTTSIEKNLVAPRFRQPKTDTERKEQTLEFTKLMRNEVEKGTHYQAQGSAVIGGKNYSIHFLFHYYHSADYGRSLIESDFGNPDAPVCWLMVAYFSGLKGRNSIGTSSCVGYLAKRKDAFYITTPLNLDELEPHMPYLAIGVPVGSETSDILEGLQASDSKWVVLDRLGWERVSESRFKEIQNELGQWELEQD